MNAIEINFFQLILYSGIVEAIRHVIICSTYYGSSVHKTREYEMEALWEYEREALCMWHIFSSDIA